MIPTACSIVRPTSLIFSTKVSAQNDSAHTDKQLQWRTSFFHRSRPIKPATTNNAILSANDRIPTHTDSAPNFTNMNETKRTSKANQIIRTSNCIVETCSIERSNDRWCRFMQKSNKTRSGNYQVAGSFSSEGLNDLKSERFSPSVSAAGKPTSLSPWIAPQRSWQTTTPRRYWPQVDLRLLAFSINRRSVSGALSVLIAILITTICSIYRKWREAIKNT